MILETLKCSLVLLGVFFSTKYVATVVAELPQHKILSKIRI